MTRFALPLCLAVLAAGCADAVTAPFPAVPQPNTDLAAVLRGRAEGVRVTQGAGMVIRLCCACSNRPRSPDEQPLLIVDGERREVGRLRDIDPAQIASIEILKGPPAMQRYGSAARNGVILIRTRGASPAARP